MRELFGDLLPDLLISRGSKANFSHSFFNAFSRSFVETWSGQGVDNSLICEFAQLIWPHFGG
jgi:hypothetical protein